MLLIYEHYTLSVGAICPEKGYTMEFKTQSTPNPPRTRTFAAVLYPDCTEHMAAFEWIKSMFRCIWIKHDPESDELKEHIHIMYVCGQLSTASAQVKRFAGWIKHVEPINDRESYAMYMVHGLPQCIVDGKKRYSIEDLKGDDRLRKPAMGQISNFVQLGDIMDGVERGKTVWEVLKDSNSDSLFEYCSEHQALVLGLSNQQIRVDQRRKMESINACYTNDYMNASGVYDRRTGEYRELPEVNNI